MVRAPYRRWHPGIAEPRQKSLGSGTRGALAATDTDVNKRIILFLGAVGALALAACGGDDAVSVDEPWARSTTEVQESGAVYFQLTVDHDDVLVGASVPSSVANEAQIHEVIESDMDMGGDEMSEDEMSDGDASDGGTDMDMGADEMSGDDMDHSSMAPGMVMQEVAGGLPLSAGETVDFAPGGYHVMLLGLAAPLEVGDEFELTLDFQDNDDVIITVPVEETAP